jgi:hypothetical protein
MNIYTQAKNEYAIYHCIVISSLSIMVSLKTLSIKGIGLFYSKLKVLSKIFLK